VAVVKAFRTQAEKSVEAPKRCPACRSEELTTTSKVISAETYWRCSRCGEVWNANRREHGSRGYRRF
jgi:transposase-like protein